jgi:serine/threonine protein kinase
MTNGKKMLDGASRQTSSGDTRKASPLICDDPNKYARPPRLEFKDGSAVFHGYQEYTLTKDSVAVSEGDLGLLKKRELLAPFFRANYLSHRTVLDLGANAGFFSFWALQNDADKAVALDMDETYIAMVKDAARVLGFDRLEVVRANFSEWDKPSDIVLALALVHWVYSCTDVFGSVNSIVKRLAELTRYMMVIEWVDPEDPAIKFFHHTNWNREFIREPYTRTGFEASLASHFARYQFVGEVSPTRRLYAAFKSQHEIDLSGPLPFILPKERVIASRCLATHDGVQYWSRVYDDEKVIHKQTTRDLAKREAYFLSKMRGHYFPRVLRAKSLQGFSIVTLEKVRGVDLEEAAKDIRRTPSSFCSFVQDCLGVVAELRRKGISHRDITADNVLVRDGKPVLLDFGWAVSGRRPYFTPDGLGDSGRPSDGSFCDVYSMGKVFDQINQHRYPMFDRVIGLMIEEDASLRVTDPDVLMTLFSSAAASSSVITVGNIRRRKSPQENVGAYEAAVRELLGQISERNQRLSSMRELSEELNQVRAELSRTQEELSAIRGSFGHNVLLFFSKHIDRLLPDNTSRGHLRKMVVARLRRDPRPRSSKNAHQSGCS